jgi:hypothetical protein
MLRATRSTRAIPRVLIGGEESKSRASASRIAGRRLCPWTSVNRSSTPTPREAERSPGRARKTHGELPRCDGDRSNSTSGYVRRTDPCSLEPHVMSSGSFALARSSNLVIAFPKQTSTMPPRRTVRTDNIDHQRPHFVKRIAAAVEPTKHMERLHGATAVVAIRSPDTFAEQIGVPSSRASHRALGLPSGSFALARSSNLVIAFPKQTARCRALGAQ